MRQLVTGTLAVAEALSRSSYAVSRSSYRLRRGREAGMVGQKSSTPVRDADVAHVPAFAGRTNRLHHRLLGAPLSARADRPGVAGEDQSRQGLRPDPAPRPSGGGLPRDGRAPRDRDAAAPVRRRAKSREPVRPTTTP